LFGQNKRQQKYNSVAEERDLYKSILDEVREYCNENIQICKDEQVTDEWDCCIEELQGVLQIIDKAKIGE